MNYHSPDTRTFNNPEDRLPRVLTKQSESTKYSKYIGDMKEPRFLYLTSSWAIVFFNGMLALPAIKNAILNGYSLYEHYSVIIVFCVCFAAIAATYKFIINIEVNQEKEDKSDV